MPNSGLVVGGMTGNLVTKGMGGVTIVVEQPIPVAAYRGGGSSGVTIPEAIVTAKALVKIKHVNPTISRFTILTQNLIVKSTIPIKIRKVAVSMKAIVAGIVVKSFVQGLSLSIRNEGIDIDEGQPK